MIASILALCASFDTPAVPEPRLNPPPMIFRELGDFRRVVQTDSEEARSWFDQGMALMLGYNFDGAIASYLEAIRRDPKFAMAWWGIAYASGPNQNNPAIIPPKDEWSFTAAKRAYELRDHETGANRALIEAIVARYQYPMPEDLTDQNTKYLEAMQKVHEQFPLDTDVAVWTAEAMICLQPWNYWTLEGEPVDRTQEFRTILEDAMRRFPDHPAANHLYIHTMESSPWPEIAEPAADRLGSLIPGCGHLVHMASHIWMQTGRYDDAAECNRKAAALDSAWFEGDPLAGEYRFYAAHNRHFLAWAACYQGRRREAVSAVRGIEEETPAPLLQMLAENSDGVLSSKWHVLVRFGLWEEILAEPAPAEWATVSRCLHHYARGVAYANTDQMDRAREEVKAFAQAQKILEEGDPRWLGNQQAHEIMPLAKLVLEGEVEFKAGNTKAGLSALKEAVAMEEKIVYAEPAPWMMPARHAYGALLIADGQFKEAEAVYLRDLEVLPANGWALLGLRDALRGQGRKEEAKLADEAFRRAWRSADVVPPASCYCGQPVAG